MSLHVAFLDHLKEKFSQFFNTTIAISSNQPIYGGDINQAYLLQTSAGRFFIKINAALFGPDFFEKEAKGLVILSNAACIRVPMPLFDGKFLQQVYLVMEFIGSGTAQRDFWKEFGESLAALHKNTHPEFGLEHNNFIGRLPQSNQPHQLWCDFYTQERVMCLVHKAAEKNLLETAHIGHAEHLCSKLKDLFPEEIPSLLHGDLWNGNFMVSVDGNAAVYDPAVYYGHREMDLAMTRLFGGFDQEFYESYDASFPLQPGWKLRNDVFQLYPLLVHLLLFGGNYRQSVTGILAKYH